MDMYKEFDCKFHGLRQETSKAKTQEEKMRLAHEKLDLIFEFLQYIALVKIG